MNDFLQLIEISTQFALTAQSVSLRRLLNGPRRPGWSWTLESMAEFLRLRMPVGDRIDAHQVRNLMGNLQNFPLSQPVFIQPGQGMPVPGEWVSRSRRPGVDQADQPVALYVHGGGYVAGSPAGYRSLTAQLACDSGTRLFCVDYRLAPDHPYPAALEDVLATYHWLLEAGTAPEQIVLVGDSAGAGLIIAAMCALRDVGDPLPAGAACLSPWVDLTGNRSSQSEVNDDYLNRDIVRACARHYCNGSDAANPAISPVYADLRGLPPLLVQIGTVELFYDETIHFVERAREAGVVVELEEWEDMIHVWHMLYRLEPKAHEAIRHVGRFIQKQVS